MTITNAVRGGGDLHSESPLQGSSCNSPRPDLNLIRCQAYRDELQRYVENAPHPSERMLAKYELICWVLEGWR